MVEQRSPEILTSMYADYLRKYLHAGDMQAGLATWLQTPEAFELTKIQAQGKRLDQLKNDEFKKVQELMGVHYGFMTNIPDQMTLMKKMLANLRDVPTLSIGCGLAPQEIFLSSQGVLTKEIHATDLAHTSIIRASEMAKEIGVTNISFEAIAGSDVSINGEFDQIMMIDSLHWMKDWRKCVESSAKALRPDGNMMIAYSPASPRIRIDDENLALELRSWGMDITGTENVSSFASTPRIFITAQKPTSSIINLPGI